MEDLKKFLSNPSAPFSEGAALLKKYGKDRNFQAFIDQQSPKPSKIALTLLNRELSRLLRISQSSPQPSQPSQPSQLSQLSPSSPVVKHPANPPINPQKQKIMIVDTLDIDYSKLSPDLQLKYKTIQAGFKEMCILHDQMKHAKTDEARAQLVDKLKTLEDLNTELWADIYEYADNNDAKKELTKGQQDDRMVQGMLKERNRRNMKEYIRRESKKLETETDSERRSVIESRIAEWQKELDE